MICRSARSITAALLVALLGILNTGMPSHSHETDRLETARGHAAISADSHSHGVILLEAAERMPSTTAHLPALVVRIDITSIAASDRSHQTFGAAPLRPSERGPPPAAPRAPPQLI
jgi:hypothetical protein